MTRRRGTQRRAVGVLEDFVSYYRLRDRLEGRAGLFFETGAVAAEHGVGELGHAEVSRLARAAALVLNWGEGCCGRHPRTRSFALAVTMVRVPGTRTSAGPIAALSAELQGNVCRRAFGASVSIR